MLLSSKNLSHNSIVLSKLGRKAFNLAALKSIEKSLACRTQDFVIIPAEALSINWGEIDKNVLYDFDPQNPFGIKPSNVESMRLIYEKNRNEFRRAFNMFAYLSVTTTPILYQTYCYKLTFPHDTMLPLPIIWHAGHEG